MDELLASARRMLGDLEVAAGSVGAADVLADLGIGPVGSADPTAIVGPRAGPGADPDAVLRAQLETGAGAVEELVRGGADAPLSDEQRLGLDVLMHFRARPALFLEDARFGEVAPPWAALLGGGAADRIAVTGRCVGRVDTGRPPHAGSGFLVGDGVVMTNCHVARRIADPDAGWALLPGRAPAVRFAPDPDAAGAAPAVPVEAVIGVHDRLDLALLRIAADGLPAPLELAPTPPTELTGHSVYVVGYPARNPRIAEPEIARAVFGDRYGVKRLQPGALLPADVGPPLGERPCSHLMTAGDVVHHDASTLGGNSGSCVVDLATHRVLGLHFAGAHRRYNDAVALWRVADDPLLAAAGVQFAAG